jgi:chromosome segregation ATPase
MRTVIDAQGCNSFPGTPSLDVSGPIAAFKLVINGEEIRPVGNEISDLNMRLESMKAQYARASELLEQLSAEVAKLNAEVASLKLKKETAPTPAKEDKEPEKKAASKKAEKTEKVE